MPDEIIAIIVIAFLPVTAVLTGLWLSAVARARRAEAIVHELAVMPALRGRQEGMGQMGDAVNAIALEVERIGEGQRFLSKALAERAPREQASRSVTPH